jgi:hypothetical protein
MRCPECGDERSIDENYCRHCGIRLGAADFSHVSTVIDTLEIILPAPPSTSIHKNIAAPKSTQSAQMKARQRTELTELYQEGLKYISKEDPIA